MVGSAVLFCALLLAEPASCTALPAGSLERAACHARLNEWKTAEETYRAYLKTHEDSLPAALGHIEVLLRMQEASLAARDVQAAIGHAVAASQELNRLRTAHPDEPAVLKLQAMLLGNVEKNPSAAEEVLKKITRIAPRDGDAWSLLGTFYLDSHRTEEGIRCFERAAAIDANPLYRAGLARGYADAGRTSEAERAFAAAVGAAKPDTHPAVFLWYGDFLASTERYGESAKAYSRVIVADPGGSKAWLKRAEAEARGEQYRDAERDALEALKRGASEREAQTLLVRVYRGLGDSAKAQAAATSVERAAVSEEERRAKWLRARTSLEKADGLMQAGRFPEALPLYTGVTAEVPDYADAWFAAGICYGQTGDAARAEQSFRSFLRHQPASAEGHSALGVLLISQQRFTEARSELQEALRLDPASAEAREALAILTEGTKRTR